jgi:hypothetical protein
MGWCGANIVPHGCPCCLDKGGCGQVVGPGWGSEEASTPVGVKDADDARSLVFKANFEGHTGLFCHAPCLWTPAVLLAAWHVAARFLELPGRRACAHAT